MIWVSCSTLWCLYTGVTDKAIHKHNCRRVMGRQTFLLKISGMVINVGSRAGRIHYKNGRQLGGRWAVAAALIGRCINDSKQQPSISSAIGCQPPGSPSLDSHSATSICATNRCRQKVVTFFLKPLHQQPNLLKNLHLVHSAVAILC